MMNRILVQISVMVIYINIYHLLLPYAFICLFLFTLGMCLILSTISVFLRDMFYIYGVMITLWMYLTPIMYDIAMIPPKLQIIFKFNPLYWIVVFVRDIVLYKQIPFSNVWLYCAVFGVGFLLFGIFIFKKKQDKFIYYV